MAHMTPGSNLKIATLSDITLGYAAPQIELLTASLARRYATSEATIIEPDMKARGRWCFVSPVHYTHAAAPRRLPCRIQSFDS